MRRLWILSPNPGFSPATVALGLVMVSIFKCTDLIATLSLLFVCHSQVFHSRYFRVAAAETTATTTPPPISVVTVTVTATPSSAASSSAPISSNTTTSSSESASPTSTSAPVVPTLAAGQLPNSFPQNSTITSGINFDTSWQECENFSAGPSKGVNVTLHSFFFFPLQSIA